MEGRPLPCCEDNLQMSLFHFNYDYLEHASLLITVDNVLSGGTIGNPLEECQ